MTALEEGARRRVPGAVACAGEVTTRKSSRKITLVACAGAGWMLAAAAGGCTAGAGRDGGGAVACRAAVPAGTSGLRCSAIVMPIAPATNSAVDAATVALGA